MRAENRPSFLKKAGSCQSCKMQLCNGLKGRLGTVSEEEGNRGGQLTKRRFSFNCGTRVKAEELMLAEGLHGQVPRKSVCLAYGSDERLLGGRKEEKGLAEMVRFLFDRKFAIKTNCRRESCRNLVRYRGVSPFSGRKLKSWTVLNIFVLLFVVQYSLSI